MAEYRSSLTTQQIEDTLVNSREITSPPSKIDEAVQFYKDSLAPLHITNLDSANSAYFTLNRTFILDTDGDFVEFEVKMNDMASAYLGTLGMVGKKAANSNNCIGYLSATDFRMRGDDTTWILFGNPGVDGAAWNKYKVVVENSGANYALYINDNLIGSQAMAVGKPIIIDNIGAAYGSNFCSMDLKHFRVKKGTDVIEAYDFLGNSDLTNVSGTETIVPGINLANISLLDITVSYNKILVEKPASDGSKIRYTIERFVNTDDTSTGGQANADNWRIKLCDHYDIDGNLVKAITNQGNWETAIKISGADDFMGGSAHGDEVLSHFVVLADGVKIDLSTDAEYTCTKLEMIQQSELTVPPNGGTNTGNVCADSFKKWQFNATTINKFWHKIKWRTSETLTDSYMWMVPIKRKVSGATGDQITDTAMRGPIYTEEDVTEDTHSTVNSVGDESNGEVRIWSAGSKYSAEVTFLKGWDKPLRTFFISASASYNKLYFDCSGNYTTSVNEIQEIELEFDVKYKN